MDPNTTTTMMKTKTSSPNPVLNGMSLSDAHLRPLRAHLPALLRGRALAAVAQPDSQVDPRLVGVRIVSGAVRLVAQARLP